MNLTLKRPLLFFDTETTGLDVAKDRIIELAFVAYHPDGRVLERALRFNPEMPIPKEATECHGISDADVEFEDPFSANAHTIFKAFSGSDLAGFNLTNFDIPILWEEFHRCNIAWDLSKTTIIDVGTIFKKMEERTLSAALKFYCEREHETAHSAMGDVIATVDVLDGQLKRYGFDPADLGKLAELSKYDNRVDLAGKLARNDKGEVIFNFGKSKGKRVLDDVDYARWMLKSDFSQETKQHLWKLVGGPL